MNRALVLLLIGIAAAMQLACSREEPASARTTPVKATPSLPELAPVPSIEALNRGARLFQEHCAQCHGPEAQGHPDWQTPGVVAAPPLNGTGNDWKRTRAQLIAVIVNGSKRNGEPVMPGWKDRLSEAEIGDLITWFQALWPPEVYARWQKANAGG